LLFEQAQLSVAGTQESRERGLGRIPDVYPHDFVVSCCFKVDWLPKNVGNKVSV